MFKDLKITRASWSSSPRELTNTRKVRSMIPLLRDSDLLKLKNRTPISIFLLSQKRNLRRSNRRSLKNCKVSKLIENSGNYGSTRCTRANVKRKLKKKLKKKRRRNEVIVRAIQIFLQKLFFYLLLCRYINILIFQIQQIHN